MEDTDIRQKALNALVILNTAVKNVRLYPPTSATIIDIIEKLHLTFQDMLAQEAPIIFAESEKILLICGHPLNEKDQEKIQVAALLNILFSFGLRSISFDKGLEKNELTAFTKILSQKPDMIKNEGGLSQVLTQNNVVHIYLDQKVYVVIDKDHKITSSLDGNDDQITRFLTSMHPELAADFRKLQEMSKDPVWLSQTFQDGLSQLMAQKGTLSDIQLTENLLNMISLLDKVTGSMEKDDKEIISRRIGKAIVTADHNIANQLTTRKMEHLLDGVLLQYLMTKLEDSKFGDAQKAEGGRTSGDPGEKGKGETGPAEGNTDNEEKEDFKTTLLKVSEKLILSMKDEKIFLEEPLMSVLPKIIEQLIAQKEQETMEKIINNLTDNLSSENVEVRAHAATSLANIIDSLPVERRSNMIESLCDKLIAWIKIEIQVTPAYKKICDALQNIIQDFINQVRYEEALPILDIFSDISTGTLKKTNPVNEVCTQVIRNLATEENINKLSREIETNEHGKKGGAGRILSGFGHIVTKSMLDLLRESDDRNERVRILHMIIEIGQKAIPLVLEHIQKDAPWYFLRNIAYILGQIGNEESAEAIQPLLRHENERVREETLKSISKIGGKRRGELLMAGLHGADEKFKNSIIDALGNAKAADAVPTLLNILTTRPFVVSSARTLLEEKICNALGAIGSAQAIKDLSEIAESRTFLRFNTYSEKVKAAAARALASIRKKRS